MLSTRLRFALVVSVAIAITGLMTPVRALTAGPPPDDTPVLLTPKGEHEDGSDEASFDKLRDAYYWSRLLSGDDPLTIGEAAALRSKAGNKAGHDRVGARAAGATRGGAWAGQGPNPIVQVGRTSNTFQAVSGRIGALAIRNDGTIILGAAQGGVWTYDATAGTWTSRTNDSDTQSVGALAIAPSNDSIVYMGSGEGALSGDSYYGDGFYRSTNGGVTWQHVSTLFSGQAVSDIAVDPTNPTAPVRRHGARPRRQPPHLRAHQRAVRHLRVDQRRDHLAVPQGRPPTSSHGATDLVMDPQNPQNLWASFWGDGIYRSTNGGATWTSRAGRPARPATSSRVAPASPSASRTRPAPPHRRSTRASTTST